MTSLPDRPTFESASTGQAPWDIGKPQQAFLDVADRRPPRPRPPGQKTGKSALRSSLASVH
jgi:hypothetical protein